MEIVDVGSWFWLILLFAIPIVNIIAIIVIACGNGNRNVVNLCRAYLLWFLVGIVLVTIVGVIGTLFGA
ncbi:MAG: hypothetical protein AAGI69_23290 [Cyanobacteria bacterium P01_H01_bin.21]